MRGFSSLHRQSRQTGKRIQEEWDGEKESEKGQQEKNKGKHKCVEEVFARLLGRNVDGIQLPLLLLEFFQYLFHIFSLKADVLHFFLELDRELVPYPGLRYARERDDVFGGGVPGIDEVVRMLVADLRSPDLLAAQSHTIDEPASRKPAVFRRHAGIALEDLMERLVCNDRIHEKGSGRRDVLGVFRFALRKRLAPRRDKRVRIGTFLQAQVGRENQKVRVLLENARAIAELAVALRELPQNAAFEIDRFHLLDDVPDLGTESSGIAADRAAE